MALFARIRYYYRFALLIVDESATSQLRPAAANPFFQLANARYEKGAMILTSNRGFAEWRTSSARRCFHDTSFLERLMRWTCAPR